MTTPLSRLAIRPSAIAFACMVLVGLACTDITAPTHTAPEPARLALNPTGTVIVTPANMRGWHFTTDVDGSPCPDATRCLMVSGPGTPPLGTGSTELAATMMLDAAMTLDDYASVRLGRIGGLRYSSYRQTSDWENSASIWLELNIDYDLADTMTYDFGRIIFEPLVNAPGTIPAGEWRMWDARAGKWWGSAGWVAVGNQWVPNPCTSSAPCTWEQLMTQFPNIGIHPLGGGVVLKVPDGADFRGNADKLEITIDGATTTFDFELNPPVAEVPALPPNTVPEWVYSDTNLVDGGEAIAGRIARNVLMVAFNTGTAAAARTTAVASVRGSVVGGIPIDDDGEGVYYIRIDADAPAAVLTAVRMLRNASGVAMVIPIVNDSVTGDYRKPVDGADARDWHIDPARADGMNWALESIRAPMAWGCSTGDATTRVAVIDQSFHQVADVVPSKVEHYATPYTTPFDARREHGNAVASIIAAQGDNRDGSTGLMWRSDLRLWDFSRPIAEVTVNSPAFTDFLRKDGLLSIVIRMRKAVDDGARVINVSAAIAPARQVIKDDPKGRAYLEERVRPALRWVLERRNGQATAPLFVFSAGNGDSFGVARDARFNGYPLIEEEFPNRVLVVASTHADGSATQLRNDSNYGPLVQIAAPGDRVMALAQNNNTFGFEGTSAAAPLVSGVAGLLISFDPSLSVAEVHDAIVQGAARAGRRSARHGSLDSIPYLDAYEALKVAAERGGAPLCGNRVWNDGANNIVVERRAGVHETIISRSAIDYAAFVHPFHGGRRVELGFTYRYDWNPSTRRFAEGIPYNSRDSVGRSGAWLSYAYISDHENNLWADRTDTEDGVGQQVQVNVKSSRTPAVIPLGAWHLPGTAPSPPERVCIMLYPVDTSGVAAPYLRPGQHSGRWECQGYGSSGSWQSAPSRTPINGIRRNPRDLASPTSLGDAVYVPVNLRHVTLAWSALNRLCNSADAGVRDSTAYTIIRQCAERTTYLDSSTTAFVYRVDTTTKVPELIPLPDMKNRVIQYLQVSENEKELIISTARYVAHSEQDQGAQACFDEVHQWISIDRAAKPKVQPGIVLKTMAVAPGSTCSGWVEGGGTISPVRIAGGDSVSAQPSVTARPAARPRQRAGGTQ